MTKRNKIIYWIATIWLALGMLSTAIVQLLKRKEEVDMMTNLGYLKEWAYAGFFFAMSGAVFSHLAREDGAKELFGPLLLLILIVVSWYFRPNDRKTILVNP